MFLNLNCRACFSRDYRELRFKNTHTMVALPYLKSPWPQEVPSPRWHGSHPVATRFPPKLQPSALAYSWAVHPVMPMGSGSWLLPLFEACTYWPSCSMAGAPLAVKVSKSMFWIMTGSIPVPPPWLAGWPQSMQSDGPETTSRLFEPGGSVRCY